MPWSASLLAHRCQRHQPSAAGGDQPLHLWWPAAMPWSASLLAHRCQRHQPSAQAATSPCTFGGQRRQPWPASLAGSSGANAVLCTGGNDNSILPPSTGGQSRLAGPTGYHQRQTSEGETTTSQIRPLSKLKGLEGAV